MKRIDQVFELHRAKSDIFGRYAPGDVAYIGNGLNDNAVLGLVKPLPKDKVFTFHGVVVSAFCEATVQSPPFIACGRAGNGLIVLEPKSKMTTGQLAYAAAYLNMAVCWRFSWYWQTTVDRLRRLEMPEELPAVAFPVRDLLPAQVAPTAVGAVPTLKRFALGDIFKLQPGDFHVVGNLPAGRVPIISCGDLDNGVCGFYDVSDEMIYSHKLTIAFNGATLAAKYHPYPFAAKDDVAVCFPKNPLRLTTQVFIQVMLKREQWRFSYYRKCFREKLKRVTVPLPSKRGKIDENTIEQVMQASPYWSYLSERLHPSRTERALT